jgi:hypothetical protein
MNKQTIISASEREIIDLIQEHIREDYDSIVAVEELGNQSWTVSVSIPDEYTSNEVKDIKENNGSYMWQTSSILDVLCGMGHLEAGDYVIDCTW